MSDKGFFCGNNTPQDPANLTDSEKKHMPVIDAPDEVTAGEPFKVSVKVGEIAHLMEEAHHIQWLDFYFGQNFYARVDLTPVFTAAEVTVSLVRHGKGNHELGTLRVVERCNLHGQWEATKEIRVKK
ncbi:MAG: class II SORL domain-containing protein [Nitrospira sp.]|nr:class II SORL domain-containing protein [bacterium]MBL7048104.1 class II SORL domain-containing protein [Nitrospira sp.]